MKLRLTLLSFCLFCVGIFSHAQDKKAKPAKPVVEDGADAIPVTVTTKKRHPKPIAEKQYDKDGNLLPPPPAPPKIEKVRFAPPKIAKDGDAPPPPKAPRKTEAQYDKDGHLLQPPPPPPIERNGSHGKVKGQKPGQPRFNPPKIVKDKPVNGNTPPPDDERS